MAKRKNENYSPVVSAGTKSPKAFLLVSVIAALCADVCVSAQLIWSAAPVIYWIFPVLAMAADALFLLCAVFTNFRFKYSVGELCAFVVFVCGIVIAENVVNFTGETVSLSTVAAVMWTLSHALSVICVVAAAVHASKRIRGNKIAKIIAATAFCALAAVCAVIYGLFVLGGGFFGQGGYGIRPLEYVYNEATDSYEVKGVMQGRGNIVVVPETFNDKKVDAVSYKVFNAEGVTDVTVMSADVKFTDAEELAHFGGDIDVHADKEDADKLRKLFFDARGSTFKAYDLANCVVPDVDADEAYVTFTYDKESYATVNGNVLPVWIGKKGETFSFLKYLENYPYVAYNSLSDEGGLYASYNDFGGKVLKELKYFDEANADGGLVSGWGAEGNTVLDGAKIEKGVKVKVEFENVYRIKIQDDNDTKYEPGLVFKSYFDNGHGVSYRFATAATFDSVLNEIKGSRDGFTLDYKYGGTPTETAQSYRDFETTLSRTEFADNTVYMYPVWTMKAPVITSLTSNAEGGEIIYGEDLEIKSSATAPANGLNVTYAWSGAYSSPDGAASGFTVPRINRTQGGTFTLTVTARGSGTSLTSTATESLTVSVEKRPVYLNWTGAETVTYDGGEHSVSFEVRARQKGSGILDGDDVSVHIYSQNSFPVDIGTYGATFKNAGTYTVGGRFGNGAAADNYYIATGTVSVQKVINKAPLDITWTGTSEFVYDKTLHAPEYTVSGGIGSDDTKVTVDGASLYANAYTNTQYYTATAVTSNGNYYIRNGATQRFTVAQREVTVSWLTDTIGYTGEEIAPLAVLSSDNLIDGDALSLSRTGFQRYTNEYTGIPEYTATAVAGNRNYKVTAATATKKFKIVPKNVSFVWESTTSFTYNGKVQYPKVADIDGAAASELDALKYSISYTGGGKDVAGGSYTAFATLSNKNYSVEETSRTSGYYTITPKGIKVSFTESEKVMPYMGSIMTPTHTVWGEIGNEDVGLELDGRGENAGSYTITARATNPNYTVVSEPFGYTIKKAPIVLEWPSGALIYNGKVHSPKATTNSKIYARDDLEIVCTYSKSDADRKNIGSFVATATLVSNLASRPASNYEIIEGAKKEFFVNYIQLDISVKNKYLVYNGNAQTPEIEILNKSAILAGDEPELEIIGSGTEVGTHFVTVRFKNNNSNPAKNYKFWYAEEKEFNTEITVTFYITAPEGRAAKQIDLAEGGKKYFCAETAEGGKE